MTCNYSPQSENAGGAGRKVERHLASANARIGVAKAAFFPVLRLTGSGGYVSADIDNLFNWDSRVWSILHDAPGFRHQE